MELNRKKIQNMKIDDIYQYVLPKIKKIYQSFQYVGITKEEFKNIVVNLILNSKEEYQDAIPYIEYLNQRITTTLLNNIRGFKISKNILNDYINHELKQTSNSDEAIKYLNKINDFLETIDSTVDQDIIIELIYNNKTFHDIIEVVFKKYHRQIVSGNTEEILDNELFISAMEAYCMLNDIEIEQNEIDISTEENNSKMFDSVKTYLNEIAQIPLLTEEQEKQIGRRIKNGDQSAKQILIQSNLRLVVSIAKRYSNNGLPLLDLIQDGNIGLMSAVDKFDVEKGYRFSTYATHWIRKAIVRGITDKERIIRIPVYRYEIMEKYKKGIYKLEQELNRTPTISEIMKETNLSLSEIKQINREIQPTISINLKIGDNKEDEIKDVIPSLEVSPESIAVNQAMQSDVERLIQNCNLSEIEQEVIEMRFGLNGEDPMFLKDISKKYNLTRERIRQIEAKALMKLRKAKIIKEYADYMDNPEQAIENIEAYRKKYKETKQYTKTFLNNRGHKENEKMKKLQTIYEYLYDYPKEQIDEVIEKLTEEEKELIVRRYGNDLENPTTQNITKEQKDKFYGSVIPKMKRMLVKQNITPEGERKRKQEQIETTSEKKIETTPEKEIEKLSGERIRTKEPTRIIKEEILNIEENIESTKNNEREIDKEDCQKILELLRTPTFMDMMNVLTVKESIIISLKLGYVDGKYFSTESISEFLGIEEKEVTETTKKVLLLYKENINKFLDNIISTVTDSKTPNKTLIKSSETNHK